MDMVAPFTLLMPVAGVITAALVLGETIETSHLVGGFIIICGLAVVTGFGHGAGGQARLRDLNLDRRGNGSV
jgi:O-acetylserine/cysteine efflux transporter